MSIKVNTTQLQSKSTYAASIAEQLKERANQINRLYYNLDSQIIVRQGIGSSIHNLQQRIERAQQEMYSISRFLTYTAERYNAAEAIVVARGLSEIAHIGATQGKAEEEKWYQSNWFKIAVGVVVIGAAVAAAVTVGGPILVGMAVGAAIGAGIGGVTGGVISEIKGGSFLDGFADGFMWGAVGGAISGGIGATGVGIAGGAIAEGAVNSAIYVGQTLQNDGQVTLVGLTTNFVIGAGFSALGTVISKRISKALGKNVANNVDEVASDIVPKFKPQELNNLESFSSSSKFAELLIQNNITETELHVLIMSNIDNLTNDEKTVLKIFREAVSMPTNDTIIQKVIPVNDIDKYLTDTDPYNTIGGCVAKLEDVKHLGNMDEIYDALRLDYSNTKFVKDGDYAVIRFMTDEVDKMNIPYSSKFENSLYIKHDINYPQTGNGFTSAKDGSLIPEFEAKGFMIPNDGAELYKVSNGVEELIAIYDEDLMRFISILSD